MRYISAVMLLFLILSALVACTPAPPVSDSREVLWQQFGNHPLDELLMAWGVPSKETHLSDGSRLVTFRRSTVYDSRSPYERSVACEVSFMAKGSAQKISDISMQGAPNECRLLALGRVGDVIVPSAQPVYPYGNYTNPYRVYPF